MATPPLPIVFPARAALLNAGLRTIEEIDAYLDGDAPLTAISGVDDAAEVAIVQRMGEFA